MRQYILQQSVAAINLNSTIITDVPQMGVTKQIY